MKSRQPLSRGRDYIRARFEKGDEGSVCAAPGCSQIAMVKMGARFYCNACAVSSQKFLQKFSSTPIQHSVKQFKPNTLQIKLVF